MSPEVREVPGADLSSRGVDIDRQHGETFDLFVLAITELDRGIDLPRPVWPEGQ